MTRVVRLTTEPIVHQQMHPSLGNNIDGPSLIRVPDWLPNPLGRYYLYFAHHNGTHLRLAYADDLMGPWQVHGPGVLPVSESTCTDHVASPDVHVNHAERRIEMFFHGVAFEKGHTDGHELQFGDASRWIGNQRTKLAVSDDGLNFVAQPRPLGASYFRAFEWQGQRHALAMPGVFYRADGHGGFERGPILFEASFRHCAVLVQGARLHVWFSRAGDAPEQLLHTEVVLSGDWSTWRHGPITPVLWPELAWEGADAPLSASARGPVFECVRQLRDPAVFCEDGRVYLLYAGGGEHALGLAEVFL